MDEHIATLRQTHQNLTVERVERAIINETGNEETRIYCLVSGIPGNPDLEMGLLEIDDFERFYGLMAEAPSLFRETVGCKLGETFHVLLSPVSRRISPFSSRGREILPRIINTHYFGNAITVSLISEPDNSPFAFLIDHARQLRRRYRSPITAVIQGLNHPTAAGVESDVRSILSSVLFDLEFSYGHGFETVNFDSIQLPRRRTRRLYPQLPSDPIEMVYKAYIPELLEYYHAGEKVDYLPFRYVCYFHVLEYFSDKSAYHAVSAVIRNMMLRPDFHHKLDLYVGRAIQVVKKESERNITDKVKLNRVLKHFTTIEEVQQFLSESDLTGHFSQEVTLDCSKPLVLPAIDFASEASFYDTLTKRIYAVRCSIVHSNPEFDESKAVPFIASAANLDILRSEIDLIGDISRTVIVKSARN